MRTITLALALVIAAVFAVGAHAGPVYLQLVINPATTAGGGATSTQSGPGRWHLYAYDDTDGSLGIAAFGITLNNITTILNRSPVTDWDDADPDNGPYKAGFGPTRSQNDTTPPIAANANPLAGAQPLPDSNPILITGFGREASSFSAKLPPGVTASNAISPSWGSGYLTAPPSPPCFNIPWVFLAEGQYAPGTPPSFSTNPALVRVQLYSHVNNAAGTATVIEAQEVFNWIPSVPGPFVVGDLNVGDVFRNAVQDLGPLPAHDPNACSTLTWSCTGFSGAGIPGTSFGVDPVTGEFTWNTNANVPAGTYSAVLRATKTGGGFDEGTLTFNVVVPEPAAIALFGIALVGALGLIRRR